MNTLLINNRRYTCKLWELMSWDKLHAILRYDEQRRRSDRQSVDRLTAELLTKIAGVRRPLAYRTDPDDRILVAERLVSYLPHELRRLENMLSDETRSPGKKANRNNRLPPEDETDWEGSPIPMSRITASAWCRASDLYLHDKWRYAPLIAALLSPQGRSSETETAGIFRSLLRPNRTGPPAVPQSLSALLLQAVAPAGRPRYGTKYVVRPAGMDRALCRRGNRTDGSDEMSGFHGLGTQQAENARIAQSNARLRTGPLSGSRGRGKYGRGETLGSKRRTPLSIRPNGSAIRPQPLLCPKVRKHDQASEPVLYRDPHRSSGIRCQTRPGHASGTVSVRQSGQGEHSPAKRSSPNRPNRCNDASGHANGSESDLSFPAIPMTVEAVRTGPKARSGCKNRSSAADRMPEPTCGLRRRTVRQPTEQPCAPPFRRARR